MIEYVVYICFNEKMELPNEIWHHILSFCDTFTDFKNWSLVCKDWNDLIGCKNVLRSVLDDEINNMSTSSNGFVYRFINKPQRRNEIILDFVKPISTLFFINWGPKPIVIHMKMFSSSDEIGSLTGHYSFNVQQPYSYASTTPEDKNTGYTCISSFGGNVSRVKLIYTHFEPILIAYK